ncbi:hypothetical protein NC651_007289 [Populus alba x Populus x berolinensis]|nr:hypothetical protein NC651_007289 [Populus alba x Populus x berolinensis]
MENGGPLIGRHCSFVSHVAEREGRLLLVLPLRLKKGVASASSITATEKGYGHGLAEMVLLAARSFRGRPVCGSDVASLLLSVEELRKRKGSEVEYGFLLVFCQKHGAKIRGETGWPLVNEERRKAYKWCSQWLQAGGVRFLYGCV